jgi:hypothetical protein
MELIESVRLKIKGHLSIIDQNNNLVLAKDNLVVNTAKTVFASSLVGSPSDDFISYIGFGNPSGGATAPVITDKALENQVHQANVSYSGQTVPYFEDQTESGGGETQASTVIFSGIIDENTNFSATEAGLFSVKEFMFSRVTFSTITKNIGNAWIVKWKLEMSLS